MNSVIQYPIIVQRLKDEKTAFIKMVMRGIEKGLKLSGLGQVRKGIPQAGNETERLAGKPRIEVQHIILDENHSPVTHRGKPFGGAREQGWVKVNTDKPIESTGNRRESRAGRAADIEKARIVGGRYARDARFEKDNFGLVHGKKKIVIRGNAGVGTHISLLSDSIAQWSRLPQYCTLRIMFTRCYRCFRPISSCLCDEIAPVETGIKFVFLMHPKEAYRQKTGTGRLSALSLADSEIIIGIDFSHNARLNELLSGKGAGEGLFPVVLYPSRDAFFTDSPSFREAIGNQRLMVILVDATWFFARKMVKLSANLHNLPKVSFKAPYRSQFEFKRQPAPECLSTIESTYYLLEELKEAGIARPEADVTPLMRTFRHMVSYQLSREQERHEAEAEDAFGEGSHSVSSRVVR